MGWRFRIRLWVLLGVAKHLLHNLYSLHVSKLKKSSPIEGARVLKGQDPLVGASSTLCPCIGRTQPHHGIGEFLKERFRRNYR
ncbi:hypothetical protein CC2G_011474 [Coprinopsis cinerea AmutBmut pab1-1]|nr:hypothetical protein CC2G_011474 [Coprinopsis cinerea AmutBmut pab1-1]